jgi:hypothetical protein
MNPDPAMIQNTCIRGRGFAALAIVAAFSIPAQNIQQKVVVAFEGMAAGKPPVGFTVAQTGPGEAPAFVVVRDATAPSGAYVEQRTTDETGSRFPLCIYDDVEAKDVALSVQFFAVSGSVDRAAGLVARYRDRDHYYIVRANALEDNIRLYRVIGGKRIQFAGVDHRRIDEGRWHSLRMEVKGRHFKVCYDGELLFEADDDAMADPGKTGLWTKADSVTRFAQFTIEPPAERRQYLFEDFKTGSALAGFRSLKLGDATAPWEYVVSEDATSPRGKTILRTRAVPQDLPASQPSGPSRSGIALIPERGSMGDGAAALWFKTLTGESGQRVAGIVGRLRDRNNYYLVRVNTREDNIQLYRFVDSKRKIIGEIHHKLVSGGEWHSLELRASGSRFQVFCDGLLQFEATDDAGPREGDWGLWCASGCVTLFDGFSMESQQD